MMLYSFSYSGLLDFCCPVTSWPGPLVSCNAEDKDRLISIRLLFNISSSYISINSVHFIVNFCLFFLVHGWGVFYMFHDIKEQSALKKTELYKDV